jgi:hypothetical protein
VKWNIWLIFNQGGFGTEIKTFSFLFLAKSDFRVHAM